MVGEGGCDPEYFLYRMGPGEARDYVEGMNRRKRQDWERTRATMGLVYKVLTGETLDMPFPWDEREDFLPTAEEAEALRRKAKEMERELNEQRKTGDE